ncbi:MAG: hypothetical protein IKS32_05695 [Solobacterium sp.]|nr:hypothetical protein [Solobacterium sp.]
MMKFEILINPAGGGGRTLEVWRKAQPFFAGLNYTVHYSTPELSLTHITAKLNRPGVPLNLIVVGGDGTVNEVLNGIRDFSAVRFGLLPAGSANDLAKDLGVKSTEEQARILAEGKMHRSADIGEVILYDGIGPDGMPAAELSSRFFVSCGLGWDAEIVHRAEISSLKSVLNRLSLGKLIYICEAVRLLFHMVPFECEVETEAQKKFYPRCLLAAVMNHRYEGGGFAFGPNARDDDGLLNLCAGNDISALDFCRLLPKAYQGKLFEGRNVSETVSSGFRFSCSRPVWVHADGEILGRCRRIDVHLMKQKLNLLF